MPDGFFLVGYADDVGVIIISRNTELAQLTLNTAMLRIDRWMRQHGLELALSKTEILLLTRQRIPTIIPMRVGTEQVETKETVKHLGITLDAKLTFWPHIKQTAQKAAAKVLSLSRLMANTYGPRQSKRRLLMSTAHSIVLYGAEVWAEALEIKKYRKQLLNVQRQGALRIACAYRTVSQEAILVVASVIPIDLLAKERKRIYDRSADIGRADAAVTEREMTMTDWHERWTNDSTARWTRRLIGDLRQWTDRRFGEVNFYLTQFLTGHGYFRTYLSRMGKVRTPDCTYCGTDNDDAEHTFFACPRWTADRRLTETTIDCNLTPDNIVGLMLQDEQKWTKVATFVETVLRRKKNE